MHVSIKTSAAVILGVLLSIACLVAFCEPGGYAMAVDEEELPIGCKWVSVVTVGSEHGYSSTRMPVCQGQSPSMVLPR